MPQPTNLAADVLLPRRHGDHRIQGARIIDGKGTRRVPAAASVC